MEMIPAIAAAFAEGAPAAGVGALGAEAAAPAFAAGTTGGMFGPVAGSIGADLLGGLAMPAGAAASGLGMLGPAGMAAAAPALGVGGSLIADAAASGLPATFGSTLMGLGAKGMGMIGQHPLAAMAMGNSLMQQQPPQRAVGGGAGPMMPQAQTVPSSAILSNFYGSQPQAQGPAGAPTTPGIGLGNYLIRKRLGLLGLGGF